jgi:hypothetical protein
MHGTRINPKVHHPVVDIDFWRAEFAPKEGEKLHDMWIDTPRRLIHMIQRREAAFEKLKKPPVGVPVDLFLWGYGFGSPEKPYTTRVGGIPWREATKPWPADKRGKSLTFIAQLCFVDSKDIISAKLPGDLLLIFGEFCDGEVTLDDPAVVLEWSSASLKAPSEREHCPKHGRLPFRLDGAIHRTVQYPDEYDLFDERSIRDAVWQGTIIGPSAFMPQFTEPAGLIATFSSILPSGPRWPLLNVPSLPQYIAPKGHRLDIELWELNIGDAGVIAICMDKKGRASSQMEYS